MANPVLRLAAVVVFISAFSWGYEGSADSAVDVLPLNDAFLDLSSAGAPSAVEQEAKNAEEEAKKNNEEVQQEATQVDQQANAAAAAVQKAKNAEEEAKKNNEEVQQE